jgi:hypothetical protein
MAFLLPWILIAGTDVAVAQSIAPEAASATATALQEPLSIRFSGDVRYRYEAIDEADTSWDRQRFRARFGLDAQVTRSARAVLRMSTGEGDPRSAHITFSDGYSRKSVGVDLAYLELVPVESLTLAAGKIPYPAWRSGSPFIGGDFNPEGFAAHYDNSSGFFASAYALWLADGSATTSDARHQGLQVGYDLKDDAAEWRFALGYNDFTGVQGATPFLNGLSYGNSLNSDGTFASKFEIVELSGQWIGRTAFGTITVFAHGASNSQAASDGDAYAGGIDFSPPRQLSSWHASYEYADIGQDSLFGQLLDGDFGGGVTDSRGHVFRVAYRPAARASATLSYFDNRVGSSSAEHDFQLLQLDIDFTF